MSEEMVKGGEILLYQNGAEKEVVNVVFHDENFWLTQKGMAELFGVKVSDKNTDTATAASKI